MALCLLAANWKTNGLNAASRVNSGFVDGLLAVIVDHGLRAESKSEAEMVQNRVLKMGTEYSPIHSLEFFFFFACQIVNYFYRTIDG
ncbi:putative tRNA(Ile)-lysidine/2-thiocytidine synthase, rossmann-like alpha/beta/alpha sandwich [Helianthus debilis subsp. tardiflorus]